MPSFALQKKYNALQDQLKQFSLPIDDQLEEERHKCEQSYYYFVRQAWDKIVPGTPYVDNWHIGAIAEHLEAVYTGQIKRLLINIPFRCGKSILACKAFHPWVWTKEPNLKFLYSAYSQDLAIRDNVESRRLIVSPWYQDLWRHKFSLTRDVNHKIRYENTKGGFRYITTVNGSVTGEGADFIFTDDPDDGNTVQYARIRELRNYWWNYVMSSRFTNPATSRWLAIQQRFREDDFSGFWLASEIPDLVHLCLPMEFEKERRCSTIILPGQSNVWTDPRTEEKELLWPNYFTREEVDRYKQSVRNDPSIISGQLQQSPCPPEGGKIKGSWFKVWEGEYPEFTYIIQSWDTAYTKSKKASASACTTWGVFHHEERKKLFLISSWRGHLEYPELKKMIIRLFLNYEDCIYEDPTPAGIINHPDLVLVEAKANGLSLVQDLHNQVDLVSFNPTKYGDKLDRASIASARIELGHVYLPGDIGNRKLEPFAQDFLEACVMFPNGNSTDYVDSMSQAFIKINNEGLLEPDIYQNPKKKSYWEKD